MEKIVKRRRSVVLSANAKLGAVACYFAQRPLSEGGELRKANCAISEKVRWLTKLSISEWSVTFLKTSYKIQIRIAHLLLFLFFLTHFLYIN
jgi:hypothetical protein